MNLNKSALALIMASSALALTGCGDNTNAQFNQESSFWEDDVNYSETKVFSLNTEEDTIFDDEMKDAFSQLGQHLSLDEGMPRNQDSIEEASVKIAAIREALEKLPVSDELKAQYEAELVAAETLIPEIVAFHEAKYDGKLDEIYRERHPEEFAKVDEAKAKKAERESYLEGAKTILDNADSKLKENREVANTLENSFNESARNWIVENDLLISTGSVNFAMSTDNNSRDKAKCEANGFNPSHSLNYYWNSDSSVCFSFHMKSNNLGLSQYEIDKMNAVQKEEYMTMASANYAKGLEQAYKISSAINVHDEAREANRNRELLASNRFGNTRAINNDINSANRALNRATNGAYSQDGRLLQPPKGRYIRDHRRVFTEVAKEKGLYELPQMTAFSPENAHTVYNTLLEQTKAKATYLELDSKGRFNVDEENKPKRLVVALETKEGKKMIANVQLRKNDKGKFTANHSNLTNGESLVDLEKPIYSGYEIYFSTRGDNEHRNYSSFLRSQQG